MNKTTKNDFCTVALKGTTLKALSLYLFKRFFCWAYFRGSLFSEGLIIGRKFAFRAVRDQEISETKRKAVLPSW